MMQLQTNGQLARRIRFDEPYKDALPAEMRLTLNRHTKCGLSTNLVERICRTFHPSPRVCARIQIN